MSPRRPLFRRLAAAVLAVLPLWSVAAPAQDVTADLARAIALAGDEDFAAARDAARGTGPVGRDVVDWYRLRNDDPEATFVEYEEFVARRNEWPGNARLRARGEERMPPGMAPDRVLAWFGDREPETGEGAVRLADALIAVGRQAEAETLLREVWSTYALTETGHQAMLTAYPALLRDLHVARTDMLLWRWKTAEARRMLPLLPEDQQALARARIALIGKSDGISSRLAAVPAALRDDPGLLYDRYNYLADLGRRAEAVDIIDRQSTSAEALGQPFRWSGWRRSLARWLMRQGDPERAYRVAARHYLDPDVFAYADLEWVAGYVALTYLDDPALARSHFETMRLAVDSPISIGRAEYWIGRANEAMGEAGRAAEAYARGAEHPTSFYGLLALEKLGLPLPASVSGRETFPPLDGSPLATDPRVQAGLALIEGGERGSAVLFFAELGRTLDREDLGTLGQHLDRMGEEYFTILLGKAGAARGMIIPSIYFPVHDLARQPMPVEPALALAIARQESEFRTDAGSRVGALGLMQLMPATAEEMAGEVGEGYSRNRLITDWQYNARLGTKYLEILTEEFGDTPPLVASGYNAGPSRPSAWLDDRGDFRLGEIGVIDWIEHIPFRETRNYVQRVSEGIPIYEARLTGQTGRVGFTRMLNGFKPIIRPEIRPATLQIPAPTDDATIAPVAATPPETDPALRLPQADAVERLSTQDGPLASSPRPRARPGG